MKNKAIILLTVLVLALAAPTTHAAIVTIAIEGNVTWVDDQGGLLDGQISTGTAMTGSYTYDTSIAPNYIGDFTTIYVFTDPPCRMILNINSIIFQTNPSNPELELALTDNAFPDGEDGYVLSSAQNQSVMGNIGVESMSWQLVDDSGTALSNRELLLSAPNLEAWPSRNVFQITSDKIGENYDRFFIHLEVTSATLVPEPITMIFMLAGGIFLRRRKIR